MLVPLDIPPGVYRNGTDYQSQGRWYDADLWRWHSGTMRPIGGWSAWSSSDLSGMARAILMWRDDSNQAWIGVGTHTKLYAVSRSGAVNDITPSGFTAGRADALRGGGYGEGPYGGGLYGTPRLNSTNIIPASVWSLDTWGEYLVGTMGGTIYEWTLDTSTDAAAVTGAPTAEAILVTEERIMMALGSDGDPRAVDWSDAEDNTDWTPTSTNLAGGKRLQTTGGLKAGRKVAGGYLLLTDVDAHLATYVGLPLVYSFERKGTGCGIVSKGAVTVTGDDQAFWMADNGFWTFNGFVTPLDCDVQDYVFSDINRTQISKVSAWHNSSFGEVVWHYPSSGSTEVDRYVAFNYREGHWSIGELDRLCGVDKSVLQYPLLVSSTGTVYEHEKGDERDGRQPYAQSGPVEIGDGERRMNVSAIIPDEGTLGDVAVSFRVGDWPMSSTSTAGPYAAAERTDCWFQGRRVAVKLTADADQDFRVGRFRFDAKPGPRR